MTIPATMVTNAPVWFHQSNQGSASSTHTIEHGNKFRHLGHLNTLCGHPSNQSSNQYSTKN
jgi:hypothetical protein